MNGIKQIKTFLGLKELDNFSYVGKDGQILRVDESGGTFTSEETPGSILSIPIYQTRVSVDHGDDGTGEMGNYDKPFQTINGAVVSARASIIGDPTLKDKIIIVVEQGEYLDETDILFDGWIHCEPMVSIKTPDAVLPALFLVHSNGENFKLTGFPDIDDGGVGTPIWDSTASFFTVHNFYLEVSLLSKLNAGDLYCENVDFNIKDWNIGGSFHSIFCVNANIKVNTITLPTFAQIIKFIDSINSIKPHAININVDYVDQTIIQSAVGFMINPVFFGGLGFSNNYDSEIRIHLESGDYTYVPDTNPTPIVVFGATDTLTSTNKMYLSSNGINTKSIVENSFFGGFLSKDLTVSGIWNCYNIGIWNIQATPLLFTANELVINSINNDIAIGSNIPTQLVDVDVIGSLTMTTTAFPKIHDSVTLTYISDLPGGGGGGNTYFLEQVGHGFVFGDIIGITELGWVKADQSLIIPADGIVTYVIDVDSCVIQLDGLYQNDLLSLTKGADYYLGDGGAYTTDYLETPQYLFTATETDEISLDIEDMFTEESESTTEYSESFIIKVDIQSIGQEVTLPFVDGYSVNAVVDWGDLTPTSNVTIWNDPNAIHTYGAVGEYDIKMTGIVTGFNADGHYSDFIEVVAWGNTGFEHLIMGRAGITKVPNDVLGSFSNLTSLNEFLYIAQELRTIPSGLLTYATNVTDFTRAFALTAIVNIPDGLLDNCVAAENFNETFKGITNIYYDNLLKYIPIGLFDNCTLATTFNSTFFDCELLTTIPNIFSKNINATSFSYTFGGCVSLETVYTDLFIANHLVENYGGVFQICASLTNIPSFAPVNISVGTTYDSSFRACSSLIGIIPPSIFQPNATSYSSTFNGCDILDGAIPSTIFDCVNVTNFSSTFYECRDITSIPAGTFNCPNLTSANRMFYSCNALTGTAPIFNTPLITSFENLFYSCYELEYIQTGMFDNCPNVIDFNRAFSSCRSIQSIPPTLFDSCTLAEIFSGTLYGFDLTSIPTGLFDNNPLITTFYDCFGGWNFLTSIPSNLFANNPLVTSFNNTFRNAFALTSVPGNLFAGNPIVTNFGGTFQYTQSLTTVPEELFANNPLVTEFGALFFTQGSPPYPSALATIPAGLFANNPNVESFVYTFKGCESLTSIPVGLFDNNTLVDTFNETFYGCVTLTSIPSGLFDNNINANLFNYCFQYCSSLTSIPSGLFDNNPLVVTGFQYTFEGCSSLTSIPSGLFDYNINISDVLYTFGNCTSLTSIPANLFDNNILIQHFSNTFYNCISLTSIPANLFDFNINAEYFNRMFANCNSLTSIPAGLFDNILSVIDFGSTFETCTSLTGPAPELWVDFPTANGLACFLDDTGLSNYGDIPVDWR